MAAELTGPGQPHGCLGPSRGCWAACGVQRGSCCPAAAVSVTDKDHCSHSPPGRPRPSPGAAGAEPFWQQAGFCCLLATDMFTEHLLYPRHCSGHCEDADSALPPCGTGPEVSLSGTRTPNHVRPLGFQLLKENQCKSRALGSRFPLPTPVLPPPPPHPGLCDTHLRSGIWGDFEGAGWGLEESQASRHIKSEFQKWLWREGKNRDTGSCSGVTGLPEQARVSSNPGGSSWAAGGGRRGGRGGRDWPRPGQAREGRAWALPAGGTRTHRHCPLALTGDSRPGWVGSRGFGITGRGRQQPQCGL